MKVLTYKTQTDGLSLRWLDIFGPSGLQTPVTTLPRVLEFFHNKASSSVLIYWPGSLVSVFLSVCLSVNWLVVQSVSYSTNLGQNLAELASLSVASFSPLLTSARSLGSNPWLHGLVNHVFPFMPAGQSPLPANGWLLQLPDLY